MDWTVSRMILRSGNRERFLLKICSTDRETDVLSFPLVPFTPRNTALGAPELLVSAYDPAFDAPFLGDIVLNKTCAHIDRNAS